MLTCGVQLRAWWSKRAPLARTKKTKPPLMPQRQESLLKGLARRLLRATCKLRHYWTCNVNFAAGPKMNSTNYHQLWKESAISAVWMRCVACRILLLVWNYCLSAVSSLAELLCWKSRKEVHQHAAIDCIGWKDQACWCAVQLLDSLSTRYSCVAGSGDKKLSVLRTLKMIQITKSGIEMDKKGLKTPRKVSCRAAQK